MTLMSTIAEAAISAVQGGPPVVTVTVLTSDLPGVNAGDKMLVRSEERVTGGLDGGAIEQAATRLAMTAFRKHGVETVRLDASGRQVDDRHQAAACELLIEVIEAPARLLIVGGGHIGLSLVRVGTEAGFRCIVIDDRPEYANEERFPEAEQVVCAPFEEALAAIEIDHNTYVVLVTRGHKQDELSMRCVIGRPWAYLGMIGSKRRTAAVLEHLTEDGFPRERLDQVHTPIGLDIGAETPGEIAVSIIAELIMARRGGSGRPMYYRRGRGAPVAAEISNA